MPQPWELVRPVLHVRDDESTSISGGRLSMSTCTCGSAPSPCATSAAQHAHHALQGAQPALLPEQLAGVARRTRHPQRHPLPGPLVGVGLRCALGPLGFLCALGPLASAQVQSKAVQEGSQQRTKVP